MENNLSARLENESVDSSACLAAIRGQRVPEALGNPLTQLCLVRGMRYNLGFADEIRLASPVFARAWNARSIMSNVVPDMSRPDEVPYCIWHPHVASESTYSQLVQRNPLMKYHVARACAVAGYTHLYRQLDVLPEVHVAEEARDNGHLAIFEDIMSAPVRYAVMDDYDRSVKLDGPRIACLNGDTAVRSSLELKQKIQMPVTIDFDLFGEAGADSDDEPLIVALPAFKCGYFDITEDGSIDTYDGRLAAASERDADLSQLLYSPLPQDLPPGNKDVLVLMAAYYGDVDRYSRLRRPVFIKREMECLMRGIFHNTLFARWCADRLVGAGSSDRTMPARVSRDLRRAITARYIMNNDLSRVTAETPPEELPYCIWYPGRPSPQTLRELVRRRPEMRPQASRACVVAGYADMFDELDPHPDAALLAEARAVSDPHYTRFLQNKVEEQQRQQEGFRVPTFAGADERWKMLTRGQIAEPQMPPSVLWRAVDEASVVVSDSFPDIYEGYGVDTGPLELSVCARDAMLKEGQDRLDLDELYDDLYDERPGE